MSQFNRRVYISYHSCRTLPYLECHHVIFLADGGPDAIYNTVALCPNCHRKMHIVKSTKDKKILIKKIEKYLTDDADFASLTEFKKIKL